ncbi:chitinase [Priestia megaterium]|uniref:chitinase n=1 Tax=Priestia megaterium TaxID=1404 RepID=UPI002674EDE1|nr:chitinase [Priestia megaterium]WKU22096.1 chitinase [Priestia megaterium]
MNLGGPYFNPLSLSNSLNTELDIELLDEGIYNIVNRYGFRGICLDLDRDIFHNKRNQVLIPAALKSLKDGYKSIGEDFFICIASYFPDLRDDDKSLPYLAELEGYYDLVCTKFYNRDNDHNGHWIDELGEFITENNHKQKENFLYYTMDFLANGKRGYPKIPHDKLVMGLPATQDASPKGYVKDPSALLNALERLKQSGTPIRGLAAHSINWEVGEDKDGQPYSYEFMNRYKGIITPI